MAKKSKHQPVFPMRSINKMVLIEVLTHADFEKRKESGIYVKNELDAKAPKGIVRSIGLPLQSDPMFDVKVGDVVTYRAGAGDYMKYNGKEYWNVSYLDLSLVLSDEVIAEIEETKKALSVPVQTTTDTLH